MQLVFNGASRPQLIPNEVNNIVISPIFTDGTGLSHVGSKVIEERLLLGQDGVVVIAATVDLKNKTIIAGPDCQMRGFVYVKEAEPLLKSIANIFVDEINTAFQLEKFDLEQIYANVNDRGKKFIKRENGREPYILPIIDVLE